MSRHLTDPDICTRCGQYATEGECTGPPSPPDDLAARLRAALDAAEAKLERVRAEERERCVAIARGCHDYSGGHSGDALDIFHHGVHTVWRALAAPDDLQVAALEAIGRRISDTPKAP